MTESYKQRARKIIERSGGGIGEVWDSARRVECNGGESNGAMQADVFTGRHRKVKPSMRESAVLDAVIGALVMAPNVAVIGRYNSGAMLTEYKGKRGFYRFSRVIAGKSALQLESIMGPHRTLAMSDIAGMLIDGRMFALEVKRPGWKRPRDEREEAQARFLDLVRANGGIGEFVTSVSEAMAAIGA